jgi:hypothetical protein
MTRHHIHTIAVALAATAAVAAPAAAQDLRSPDAADLSGRPLVATVDLRSPDAADPYSGIPVRVVEHVPAVSVREVDSAFDWGDAGVGAGALFTLALLAMGGSVVVKHRGPAFR